jgi:hypothetical protein
VHEAAQATDPDSRVVYADIEQFWVLAGVGVKP